MKSDSPQLDSTAGDFLRRVQLQEPPEIARRVEELLLQAGHSDPGTLMWAFQQAQDETDGEELRAAALSGNLRCDSE